jgi:hypothetical protein
MNDARLRGDASPARSRRNGGVRAWVLAALGALALGGTAAADDPPVGPVPDYANSILEGKPLPKAPPSAISQVGCCGNNLSPTPMITGGLEGSSVSVGNCPPGCPTGHCIPGRKCPDRFGGGCGGGGCGDPCDGKFWNLCGSLFECFCCPDPCYEPQWLPQANAAFFVDHARPQSHMRIRWDHGADMFLPDRNEFFWARIGRKGPRQPENTFGYHDFTMYTEIANGGFGFFVEGPFYRILDTNLNPYDAGWGDMNLGTKSMFIDCELLQLTFQFRTWIPTGPSIKGFGTGHVTLEPSLLATLKVTPNTYVETQISEWIPIGGDDEFAGTVLHTHTSINHLLCRKKALQFIGTLEYQNYIFQDGALTLPANAQGGAAAPNFLTTGSSGEAYHYAGPGFRIVICDKYDIGFGAAFSLTSDHFADQLYRTEFRVRW